MSNPIIQFNHVSKKYSQNTAVDDLSFSIDKGEFVTVLGSSGCGKTTTLKMINGLIQPTSGTITIAGKRLSDWDLVDLRRHIGYVVQQIGLFPHMTIADNIAVVPKMLGWEQDKIDQRIQELLELVQLNPAQFANRYPGQLSGGQQQRVGVARALAANPPYILFDEPFGALDALTRIQLQKELKRIHAALADKTFLFVTHDINEALFLGQRVMVMNQGRLEQFDVPAQIVHQPKTQFVKELLGTVRQNHQLWEGDQDD
ncbi:ABC transporter ATP-binding protein [Limosilactobacillus sp.]|uniref:ABC transporter ATP-binding protein n=1 Tax=Limosilactobacillus sp. TaxID=2773925 RepID=UPI003F0B085B